MLDIAMPEIALDGAGIDAIVGELIAAGVPQHVRMRWKRQTGSNPSQSDQLMNAATGKWRTTFRCEHKS